MHRWLRGSVGLWREVSSQETCFDRCVHARIEFTSQLQTILREQFSNGEPTADIIDSGTVIYLGDGIARVYGCEACLAGELLEFADGTLGLALNLESQTVGVVRFAKTMGDMTDKP